MGLDSVGDSTQIDFSNDTSPLTAEPDENEPNVLFLPNPEDMHPSSNPLFAHIIIFYTLTFIIGLVSNIIAMAVMIGDRKNRSTTSMFLTSLTAADLLLVVVCIPIELLHYFIAFRNIGYTCKLAKYTELLSPVASVLNLCAVSFERVIVIVFPMRSRSLCTMSNCRRTIFLVWVLASILSIPVIWVVEGYSVTYTNNVTSVSVYYCQETVSSWPYALYQVVTIFAFPGIFMSVCYTYVIRELWKSTRTITMLTNASSFRSRNARRNESKSTTRLSTVEEESMYTSTTQSQSQKRMDTILRPINANFSVSSPRTETVTLSEIDTTVETGLELGNGTATESETMETSKEEAKIPDKKDEESMKEEGAEANGKVEFGPPAKKEDINGNAMKPGSTLETDKKEDLETCGKKSEKETENELEKDESLNFQTATGNNVKSVNELLDNSKEKEDAQDGFNEKIESDNIVALLQRSEGCVSGDEQPNKKKNRTSLKNPLMVEHDMEAIKEVDSELSEEHHKSSQSEHNGTLSRTRCKLQYYFRKKSHLTTQQLKAEEAKSARKQVIVMLILVIIMFMICWGPRVVLTVIIKACGSKETCFIYTPLWYKIRIFFSLIPYVHCSINPFIYSFMSKNFKRSMRRQLNRLGTYFGCNWFGCKGPSNESKSLMHLRSQDVNRTVTGHVSESTTNIL